MFETQLEMEKACAKYIGKGYRVTATFPGGAGYFLTREEPEATYPKVLYLLWVNAPNVKKVS